MSEFKKIGHVSPTDGLGSGGAGVKPGKVSDLLNPSTSQIQLYDSTQQYNPGEYVMIKEKNVYVIYKSLKGTTGNFDPSAWEKYTLGDTLAGIRADMVASTNQLMSQIVKGGGGSSSSSNATSGILDWIPTGTSQIASEYNPFLGFLGAGFATYNGIVVDGTVVEHDVTSSFKLNDAPSSGVNYELVFLEAFRVLENNTIVMKHRLRSFLMSELDYKRAKKEGSYFMGLSTSRTRFVQAQGSNDKPFEESPDTLTTSNAYRFATFLSADEREASKSVALGKGYASSDKGLWVAGDGSDESIEALGTVDGYSFAIPLTLLRRRNTATGSSDNVNGGSDYVALVLSSPMTLDPKGTGYASITSLLNTSNYLKAGLKFIKKESDGSEVFEFTNMKDGSNRYMFKSLSTRVTSLNAGTLLVTTTSNPYNKYTNVIESGDVIDIQYTLTNQMSDFMATLDSNFNKFMRGELLESHEELISETFESENNGLSTTRSVSNLVPEITAEGVSLVNVLSGVQNTDGVFTTNNDTISPTIKRLEDGSYNIIAKVVKANTSNVKKIVNFLEGMNFVDFTMDGNYLIAMDIKASTEIQLVNNNNPALFSQSVPVTNGLLKAVKLKETILNNLTIETTTVKPVGTTITINISNIRMYNIGSLETVATKDDSKYPHVVNISKKAQNLFVAANSFNENDTRSIEYISDNNRKYTVNDKPMKIGTIAGESCVLTADIEGPSEGNTVMLYVYGPNGQSVVDISGNMSRSIKVRIPYNSEYLSIGGDGGKTYKISNIQVRPLFSTQSTFVPSGTWSNNTGDQSFTHRLTAFDRYRKIWSNKPSSTKVTRTIYPDSSENLSDVSFKNQRTTGYFSGGDKVHFDSQHVIGPVVDSEVLANSSRIVNISGSVITLDNTKNLVSNDKVNIYNPNTMTLVVGNVSVTSVDSVTNAITLNTAQELKNGYLVLEAMNTPFIPTTDDMVQTSWESINTKTPDMVIKNLTPKIGSNPFSDVTKEKMTKIFNASDLDIKENPLPPVKWVSVSTHSVSFAIDTEGQLWVWGQNNTNGQLGFPGVKRLAYATCVKGMTDCKSVSTGDGITLVVKKDGSLWACGDRSIAGSGLEISSTPAWSFTKVPLPNDTVKIKHVEARRSTTTPVSIAIAEDGDVYTCGTDTTIVPSASPTFIKYSTGWKDATASNGATLFIKEDGSLWGVGDNISGLLLGVVGKTDTPVRLLPDVTNLSFVKCTPTSVACLTEDGKIYYWGSVMKDDGTGDAVGFTKERALSGTDWVSVDITKNSIIGVKKNGTAWFLGVNHQGSNVFAITQLASNIQDILSSSSGSVLTTLTNDGTIKTMGKNSEFLLGAGRRSMHTYDITRYRFENIEYNASRQVHRKFPKQFSAPSSATVAGNYNYTGYIDLDGYLYMLGLNVNGQLGDNSMVTKNYPVKAEVLGKCKDFAISYQITVAIAEDGTLWYTGTIAANLSISGMLNNVQNAIGKWIQFDTNTDWERIETNSLGILAMRNNTLYTLSDENVYNSGIGANTNGKFVELVGANNEVQLMTKKARIIKFGLSGYTGYVLFDNGKLFTWGFGGNYQTLNGSSSNNTSVPSLPTSTINSFVEDVQQNGLLTYYKIGSKWYAGGYCMDYQTPSMIGRVSDRLISDSLNIYKILPSSHGLFAITYDGDLYYSSVARSSFKLSASLIKVEDATGMLANGVIDGYITPYSTFIETVNGLTGISYDATDKTVSTVPLSIMSTSPNTLYSKADYLSDYAHKDLQNKLFVSKNNTFVNYQDGTLWAAGRNDSGMIPTGKNYSNISSTYTLRETNEGVFGKVRKVVTGDSNTFLLYDDGRLYISGSNSKGLLWLGTTDTTFRDVFNRVPLDYPVEDIDISGNSAFIILSSGTMQAVGVNNYGQLGVGTTTDVTKPTIPGSTPEGGWRAVATTGSMTFAIGADGRLNGWGDNQYGCFGENNPRTTPYQLSTDTDWVSIKTGTNFAVGMKTDGSLWSIGRNNVGQCGQGSLTDVTSMTKIGTSNDWKNYACGGYHVIAVKKDGTLWSWGINDKEQQANPVTGTSIRVPTRLGDSSDWDYVCAGTRSSHAVKLNGEVFVWGDNQYGQLALGSITPSTANMTLLTSRLYPRKYISVSTGMTTMVVDRSRTLMGKGYNKYYLLNKTSQANVTQFTEVTTPAPNITIPPIPNRLISSVSQNSTDHAVCISTINTLYGWGSNEFGQLGHSTYTNTNMVIIGNDIMYATALGTSTFGIKTNGTVVAAGRNDNGQLGVGSTTREIGTLTNTATSISEPLIGIGTNSYPVVNTVFGWTKSGKVFATGLNNSGEMGIAGDLTSKTVFTEVTDPNLVNVVKVCTNQNATYALRSDGTVWGWGVNRGFCIDPKKGEYARMLTPVRVYPLGLDIVKVRDIYAQGNGLTVILEDGRVFTTGLLGNSNHKGYWYRLPIPYRASSLEGYSNNISICHEYGHALVGLNTDLQITSSVTSSYDNPVSIDPATPIKIPELVYADSSSKTGVGLDTYGSPFAWADCSMFGESFKRMAVYKTSSTLKFTTIAVSDYGIMGISGDGLLYSVGSGVGVCAESPLQTYTQIGTDSKWGRDLSIFDKYGFAITLTGDLYGWGDNTAGALGIPTSLNMISTPTKVESVSNVSKVYAKAHLIIKDDGSLMGTTDVPTGMTPSSTFQSIFKNTLWKSIAKNSSFAKGHVFLGVQKDGTLWSYGMNGNETLTQIGTSINWVTCAINREGTSYRALNSKGEVYVFGLSHNGSLSLGSTLDETITDLRMLPLINVQAITGDTNPIYVTSQFEILISGSNLNGLIDPSLDADYIAYNLSTVYQNALNSGIKKIVRGYADGDIIILRENGTMWGMGANSKGILGLGHTRRVPKMTQLNAIGDWSDICMTNGSVYALTASGDLYSWGDNRKGQLGIGVIDTDEVVPTRIVPNFVSGGWTKIYAKSTYNTVSSDLVLAIKEQTKEICVWGGATGCIVPTLVIKSPTESSIVTKGAVTTMSLLNTSAISVDGGLGVISSNDGLYYVGHADDLTTVENVTPHKVSLFKNIIPSGLGIITLANDGIVRGIGRESSGAFLGLSTGTLTSWTPHYTTSLKLMDLVGSRAGSDEVLKYGITSTLELYVMGYVTPTNSPFTISSNSVFKNNIVTTLSSYKSMMLTDGKGLFIHTSNNDLLMMGGIPGYIQGTQTKVISQVLASSNKILKFEVSGVNIKKFVITHDHLVILGSDNKLYGIGNNAYGQLIPGGEEYYNKIVKINSDEWVDIGTAFNITVALSKDGRIFTWGSDYLTTGQASILSTATQLGTDSDWVEIHFRNRSLFAKKADKTVWALGFNQYGNLGVGRTDAIILKFTEIPALKGAHTIEISETLTVAEISDGTLIMTGNYTGLTTYIEFMKVPYISTGTLYNGNNTGVYAVPFAPLSKLPTTTIPKVATTRKGLVIEASDYDKAYVNGTLAKKLLGSEYKDMSDKATTFQPIPVSLDYTNPNGFVDGPSFFDQDVIYLRGSDGDIYTTGTYNFNGIGDSEKLPDCDLYKVQYNLKPTEPKPLVTSMLYNGTRRTPYLLDNNSNIWVGNQEVPFKVSAQYRQTTYRKILSDVKKFYTNGRSVIIEDDTGKFWVKGGNNSFELGGEGKPKLFEELTPFDNRWDIISFSPFTTGLVMGVRNDKTVWAWGGDYIDPVYIDVLTKLTIDTDVTIQDISIGYFHVLVRLSNNSIYAYTHGYFENANQYGQMATGDNITPTTQAINSIKVSNSTTQFKKVFAGYDVSYAIGIDGKLYSVGNNSTSLLGDPTVTTSRNVMTPVPIGPNNTKSIKTVHATRLLVAVLTTDGEVYIAGRYDPKRLLFASAESNSFVKLDTPNVDIIDVKVGSNNVYLLCRNGDVYTRGANGYGQLGYYPLSSSNEWHVIPSQGIKSLYTVNDAVYGLTENNDILLWGRIFEGFGKSETEILINQPIGVSYQELYGKNVGLQRNIKTVDNVVVNDITYKKGYSFTLRIPIDIDKSYVTDNTNKLSSTIVDNTPSCTILSEGVLFSSYIDKNRLEHLFNVSSKELLSYVSKVKFTASVKAKSTGVKLMRPTGDQEVSVNTTYSNIAFELPTESSADPLSEVPVLKMTGVSDINPLTMVDPTVEVVFNVPDKTNSIAYVPPTIKWDVVKGSKLGHTVNPFALKSRGELSNPNIIQIVNGVTSQRTEIDTSLYTRISEGKTGQFTFGNNDKDFLEIVLDIQKQMDMSVSDVLETIDSLTLRGSFKNNGADSNVNLLSTDGTTQTIPRNTDGSYTLPVNALTLVANGQLVLQVGPLGVDGSLDVKLPSIQFNYKEDVRTPHFNVVYVNAVDGAVETLFPVMNKMGEFDKISTYYRSLPKLQPVTDTTDMVVLAESDHVLVTDIGDITLVDQGEAPFTNPLSQFDYDYKDLLGVLGFEGLTFTGDSARVNIDSKISIKNGILTGATQQRIVKDFGTNAVGITRMLVWYNDTVNMLISIIRTEDGVLNTQSPRATRYLVPIEGNIHMNEPDSKTRKTILNKKVWR